MRLVAVSIVKNEADIIEAFVRHTQAWVNHHLIFDHDSTDGTRQILGALRDEGLSISLFTDDALENLQQARSNHLLQVAIQHHAADWLLPLDADEFLSGPNRTALEVTLAALPSDQPVSVRLLNYYPTKQDDEAITNPALRLRYCQATPAITRKIFIPKQLLLESEVSVGKGSHVIFRANELLVDRPLPEEYHLSHLALRSPQHQVLRVVLAELQKLSRGKAHAGLDVHYRLGFQLLAEDPSLFFSTVCPAIDNLRFKPIDYRGGPLASNLSSSGWNRLARALVPYLEKLATSHGRLADQMQALPSPSSPSTPIRALTAEEIPPPIRDLARDNFCGFTVQSGLGPREGPVPEAFLPPFHWGYAPATHFVVQSNGPREARLAADVLTYSEDQTVQIEINGQRVLEHSFARVNQKEHLHVSFSLRDGANSVVISYGRALITDHDARPLAVIFLSLQILPATTR